MHNCPPFVEKYQICSKKTGIDKTMVMHPKINLCNFFGIKKLLISFSISNNLDSFISINIYINLENQCNCKNSRPPNFYSFCTIT